MFMCVFLEYNPILTLLCSAKRVGDVGTSRKAKNSFKKSRMRSARFKSTLFSEVDKDLQDNYVAAGVTFIDK